MTKDQEKYGLGFDFSDTSFPVFLQGKVLDYATGQPIEGVNIYVKGNTTVGTSSNASGDFDLAAFGNNTIVFSHQSFGVEEYEATEIKGNVYMFEKANALNEVTITNKKNNWIKYAGIAAMVAILIYALSRKKK